MKRYTTKGFHYESGSPMARLQELENKVEDGELVEIVTCKNCKYLMFSDCYGECRKAYRGIVNPNDYCGKGEKK